MVVMLTETIVIQNQFLSDLVLSEGQLVYLDGDLGCDEHGNHFDTDLLEGKYLTVVDQEREAEQEYAIC